MKTLRIDQQGKWQCYYQWMAHWYKNLLPVTVRHPKGPMIWNSVTSGGASGRLTGNRFFYISGPSTDSNNKNLLPVRRPLIWNSINVGITGEAPQCNCRLPNRWEKNRRQGGGLRPPPTKKCPNRPATQWNQSIKSSGGTTLKNLARLAPYSGIFGSRGPRS